MGLRISATSAAALLLPLLAAGVGGGPGCQFDRRGVAAVPSEAGSARDQTHADSPRDLPASRDLRAVDSTPPDRPRPDAPLPDMPRPDTAPPDAPCAMDLQHCGPTCTTACDEQVADTCSLGSCDCGSGPACTPGSICCGGTCVSPTTAGNCGACGMMCSSTCSPAEECTCKNSNQCIAGELATYAPNCMGGVCACYIGSTGPIACNPRLSTFCNSALSMCQCGAVKGCDATTADHCDTALSPPCRCGSGPPCIGLKTCQAFPGGGAACK